MRRSWIVLIVGALVLCFVAVVGVGVLANQGLRHLLRGPALGVTASNATGTTPAISTRVNRLLIQGDDGNLYTVWPDGTERQSLTTDASESRAYRQPTWAPSGDRVAWARVDQVDGEIRSAIITSRLDGAETTEANTFSFAPFYISWSPDSGRLAFLSNWIDGLALRVVDVAGGGEVARKLDSGQQFYFAWAPDGQRLLTHVGSDGLALLSLNGEKQALDREPALFGAPQWGRDASQLVIAVRDGDQQRLVVFDIDGDTQQEVVAFRGNLSFALSPDGRRIAYVDTTARVSAAAFGPLAVVDLETGQRTQVTSRSVFGFFWSPDGKHVAFLGPDDRGPAGPQASMVPFAGDDRLWFRWCVWDGADTQALGRVIPSDTFLRDYLRYFDQYARSMTPWAPDSSAFVYAGEGEDGTRGIWVQSVTGEHLPRRVADGVYAGWSPR